MTNEQQLQALSDGELTDIADAHGIELDGTETRAQLINKILDAGEQPEGEVDEETINKAREHHGDA